MGYGTGVASQFAYKKESTPDTYEPPDGFLEFVNESFSGGPARIESQGLAAGRAVSTGWAPGNIDHEGAVQLELVPESTAGLLELCMGTVSGPTGAGPYIYTFTPGVLPKFSANFGVPPASGATVLTKSLIGAMVNTWQISGDASGDGQMIQFQVNAIPREVDLTKPLPTATYPTFNRWTTVQTSLTLAGAAYCVDSFTLTGENNLIVQHKECVADAGLAQVSDSGIKVYTGAMVADFEDYTAYNRFISGTEAALVVTISDGTYSLVITMNVRFDGATPMIEGPEIVKQPLEFRCQGATDAQAITMVLTSPDSAI